MTDIVTSQTPENQRSTKVAIRRGLMCHCPACGEGKLFTGYLKVTPTCAHCGEALHHQKADDGPAYLTMLIACHIAGLMLHLMVAKTTLGPAVVAGITFAVIIPLSLWLLPRMKGLMIGIQWANRMHGFGRKAA